MYSQKGVGVIKLAEEGMGFIANVIYVGMILVFIFYVLNVVGVQVGNIRDMLSSIRNTDASYLQR